MVGRNILAHHTAKDWNIVSPSSIELNLTDSKAVMDYVKDERPDIVVHAAGQVGGIQSNLKNPVSFLERNLSIGRNIIMAAYENGVHQFINLASTCMYPRYAVNPLSEELILTGELEPTNEGYALAKIAATRLCQYINRQDRNAKYKTIIPCNLYGMYDKFEPEHSHLLPAIIRKIHIAKETGLKTVEIWGDGTARREFMYASDLADAILKGASNVEALPELMNCGLGIDHSITEYYETVADVIGWHGEFIHDLSKPTGMKQKLCNTEKQKAWGWIAPTTLRDGIKMTYEFYQKEAQK